MPNNNQAPLTVAQSWGMFSRIVFGDTPPGPIQYQEMRRAFYAGFHTMLVNFAKVASLDEQTGIDYFNSIHQECIEFATEIERGFA